MGQLHDAAQKGDLEQVKKLTADGFFSKPVDINEKDWHGWTALMWAAKEGHLEVVSYLVEKHNNLNEKARKSDKKEFFSSSSWFGFTPPFGIDEDSHSYQNGGGTAFIIAAGAGHLEVVRYLIEKGAKLKEKNNDGETALMRAAGNGHLEVVRCLVDKGAALNEKNKVGYTALMLAASSGHLDAVRYLVDKGAKLEEKNNDGDTVLMRAVSNGHLEVVRYLTEKGAKLDEKDKDDNTVLMRTAGEKSGFRNPSKPSQQGGPFYYSFGDVLSNAASEEYHDSKMSRLWNNEKKLLEMVRYLIEKGAKSDEKDKDGNTVLMRAASEGHLEVVRYLVKQGAAYDTKNNAGKDALDLARAFAATELESGNPASDLVAYLSNQAKLECGMDTKHTSSSTSFFSPTNLLNTVKGFLLSPWTESATEPTVSDEEPTSHQTVNTHSSNNNNSEKRNTASASSSSHSKQQSIDSSPQVSASSSGSSMQTVTSPPQIPLSPQSPSSLHASLIIPYHELKFDTPLGQGTYGTVFKAEYGYETVAVKQLNMTSQDEKSINQFKSEAEQMAALHSKHTLRLVGICLAPYYCLVMEFMVKGSLHDYLEKNSPTTVQWLQRFQLALEIGKGLAYLHAKNVIHRDIKSPNILLDENEHAKLGDFGLSMTKCKSSSGKTKSSCGTMAWMAPELLDPELDAYEYNTQTDVFAYGMVLYELASHQKPFDELKEAQISGKILANKRPDIPQNTPLIYSKLMTDCWTHAAQDRPKTDHVIAELENLKRTAAVVTVPPKHASLFSK